MAKPTGYQLNHRITIQQNADDGTAERPSWQDLFANVWAAKQGLSEKNFYMSGADQSKEKVTFIIHFSDAYYSQIRGSMQLIDSGDTGRPYRVIGPPVDIYDDRRWLKIHAERICSNGN